MTKRERLLKAFDNQPVDRVPVGFWLHFVSDEDLYKIDEKPQIYDISVKAHKKFIEEVDPDFVKIMSDGYFTHPLVYKLKPQTAADLYNFAPIEESDPWITQQVALVKQITCDLKDTSAFYNIFAPANLLRLGVGNDAFLRFMQEDPEAVAYASNAIAKDTCTLTRLVMTEGGCEGIYLSVQNPYNTYTPEQYAQYIAPSELEVLQFANAINDYNILHCCGYDSNKNNLSVWKDYPAKAINWATAVEEVTLAQGKELFGGKAVIGGFDNRAGKLLHKGSKGQIEQFTEEIIAKTGKLGVILGADCTVQRDIALERLEWVRQKAIELA